MKDEYCNCCKFELENWSIEVRGRSIMLMDNRKILGWFRPGFLRYQVSRNQTSINVIITITQYVTNQYVIHYAGSNDDTTILVSFLRLNKYVKIKSVFERQKMITRNNTIISVKLLQLSYL